MAKAINEYDATVWTSGGNVKKIGPVRAENKKDAARRMKCDLSDVRFVKHTPITDEEIVAKVYIGQHPSVMVRLARIAVNNHRRNTDSYGVTRKKRRRKGA